MTLNSILTTDSRHLCGGWASFGDRVRIQFSVPDIYFDM